MTDEVLKQYKEPGHVPSCGNTSPDELESEVARLSQLSIGEYETERKSVAKRLDVRPSILDAMVKQARGDESTEDDGLGLFEPEPWPEPVDGDDLLDRMVGALCRHVVMPQHVPEAVALWCVHAHAFENWQHTPRLAIGAPEKGCGKSLLLDVIACLVPRALQTDSLSEAVAFRLAESHKPTFLIDECDTHIASKNPDDGLRGILNSGHAKGKRALRCVGDDNQVRGFNTFGPVALAGIGKLPPTLADRSIKILLHRRKADEYVQDFRSDRVDHLRELASQIARWVTDNKAALCRAEPVMPQGIYNRRADVWRPLLAIADVAGADWPERARLAVVGLESATLDDDESFRVLLLADIRQIFDELGDDQLSSEQIVKELHEMEERPWSEYGKKQKKLISKNQVARLLKSFAISPSTIRDRNATPKGYRLSQFKEAFGRYLPSQTATPPQVIQTAGLSPIPNRNKEANVAVEKPLKAPATAGCGGVAVENPPRGGVYDNWEEI